MSWYEFLASRGAMVKDHLIQKFPQPSTLNTPIITDLTGLGLLCFEGEESALFLQNQLSSDVNLLADAHHAQYSSYSTPKGRMLASFLAWQYQQNYYLQLDPALLPSIQKRLSMYIFRTKTKIRDTTENWGKFGLAGQGVRALLEGAFSKPMPKAMEIIQLESGTFIIGLPGERFECLTQIDQAPALWMQFVEIGCKEADDNLWQLSEIRAGVPWITQATQETFIPQMINLDLIGGISFTKGCYPGQEIVARTHYLGKLKRRMYHALVDTNQPIAIGTDVFSTDMQEQTSGKILNSALSAEDKYEVLVVAQTQSLPHGLHVASLTGPELTISEPVP